MARNHARILVSIWDDDDFRGLEPSAQRVYFLLVSQPDLTPCGALPYLPGRWSRLAQGTTEEDIVKAITILAESRFVLVDEETQELIVRTFVVHDGGLGNPKMRGAVKGALRGLHSRRLRGEIVAILPEVYRPEIADGLTMDCQSFGDVSDSGSPIRLDAEVGGRRQGCVSSSGESSTVAEQARPTASDIQRVFDAWVESTGKTRAVLDAKRKRVAATALKSYDVEYLCLAVTGWKFSPHHRGENDRGTVYNDIGLLLRDAAHIESFHAFAISGPQVETALPEWYTDEMSRTGAA